MTALKERFGISAEEAERIAARWEARWQEASARVDQLFEEAAERSTEAAEAAAEASASAFFWAAIISLLGLLAAAAGGAFGRPEDEVEVAHAR